MRIRTSPTGIAAGDEDIDEPATEPHPIRVTLLTWGLGLSLVASIVAGALFINDAGRRADAPTPARSLPCESDGFDRGLSFSRDGRALAAIGTDNHVRVWWREGDAGRRSLAARNPRHAVFSRDGATLASGGDDEVIRLWKVEGFPRSRRDSPRDVSGPKTVHYMKSLNEYHSITNLWVACPRLRGHATHDSEDSGPQLS